jgi:hypothetical protein
VFGFLGALASALIPGAAPIIALASAAARAFGGGGGAPPAGTPPAAPLPPPPPPPPPFDPRVGSVTPVAEMNGGVMDTGAPFVGDAIAAPSQPVPDGGDFGRVSMAPDVLPPEAMDVQPTPTPADVGGGFNLPALISGAGQFLGGLAPVAGAVAGVAGRFALPAIGAVLGVGLLRKTLEAAGVAASVYALYTRLRAAGHSHRRARRLALQAHGVHLRRRRMRPTNIHALRRAVRRLRGFRRIVRKVHGVLGTSHRGGGGMVRRRRHFRRGDVNPFMVEDTVDAMDEAEDFGVDEGTFRGAAEEVGVE